MLILILALISVAPLPSLTETPLSGPINDFSTSLFSQISREEGQKNVITSPFSVSTALSMLALGARTTTATELQKGLHFDQIAGSGDRTVHELFKQLRENQEKGNTVTLANYLLLQKQRENSVLQRYKQDIESFYDALVNDVDFASEGEAVKKEINTWASTKTHGLIQSMLDSPPDPGTVAILLNAIHFKDKWLRPFFKGNNQMMEFFNRGTDGKQTEFMTMYDAHLPYAETTFLGQPVQALELPYLHDQVSMIIILPRNKGGLKTILDPAVDALNLQSAIHLSGNLNESPKLNIFLPKFKIESDLTLKPALIGAGIKEIFSPTSADLSGITGQKNLYISAVKHKAVIRVDEEGTEAAAVTLIQGVGMSMQIPYIPPIDFRADHPFLFLIRSKATGIVLFMGKLEEL